MVVSRELPLLATIPPRGMTDADTPPPRTNCSPAWRESRARCGAWSAWSSEDRYCIDVVTQISAIQAALDKVALGLLDDHARHCVAATPRRSEMMAAVGRLVRRP